MGISDVLGWEIRVKLLVKLNTSLKKSGKAGNMLKTQVESHMGISDVLGWEIRVKFTVCAVKYWQNLYHFLWPWAIVMTFFNGSQPQEIKISVFHFSH